MKSRLFGNGYPKSLDFLGVHGKIVDMDRILRKYIIKDLETKIILLTGP
jgi:hypothetical protein